MFTSTRFNGYRTTAPALPFQLLSRLLLLWFICLAVPGRGQIEEGDIRDQLTGRREFGQQRLREMDSNTDGRIDIADLFHFFSNSSLPVASFQSTGIGVIESSGAVRVPIEFSRVYAGELHYSVDGSAQDVSDYIGLSGKITVKGTSAIIPVSVVNDAFTEPGVEELVLTLSPTSEYTVGKASRFTIAINDDDGIEGPLVYFDKSAQTVGEGDSIAEIQVRFTESFTGTLGYSIKGTATSEMDFNELSGSVLVTGDTATIPVGILEDVLSEGNETVELTLESPTGATLGLPAMHTLTIRDNDGMWRGTVEKEGSGRMEFVMSVATGDDGKILGEIVSNGEGFLPDGRVPLSITMGGDFFKATMPPLTVAKDDTLFDIEMTRTFTFDSNPSVPKFYFSEDRFSGVFVEKIAPVDPVYASMTTCVEGSFYVVRQPGLVPIAAPNLIDE